MDFSNKLERLSLTGFSILLKIGEFMALSASHVSISPTFYEQLLHQNPFAKKLQTQIVST